MSCAIFAFPSLFPLFVSLFNIHKCNPLNLKSFPAHVNECNHKSMVEKPQEHMNKSAERKEGEKRGVEQGEEWNKTGSFYPSGLPVPRKCNRLNPWCCCGFSSMSHTVPNRTKEKEKSMPYTLWLKRFPLLCCVFVCFYMHVWCIRVIYPLLCVCLSERAYLVRRVEVGKRLTFPHSWGHLGHARG